ncbi:hypothetical protein [Pandoraea soli]|uniref:hypothetical protein n=1 Tax=Pandoraea soli TaxID=2508293 RepID=UPI0012424F83|nr:hypothetical protein [Pandoraea soli]
MKPLADQKGDVGALAPIGKPNSSQAGSKSRMGQKADRNPYRKPGTVAGRSYQERQYRQELQRLITGLGQNAVFRRFAGSPMTIREAKRGL